jgi:cilia- and flagella-associated protein 57
MLRQEREDRENQRDKYRSVFDEAARQLEQDIDTEVQGMLKHYRAHLHSEKEATLGFKGQNGIMKKKFHALQKEIEEQGERREELGDKNGALREQIGALNREIDAHKKEIHQRDGTIGVKEKKIYDLKKKNQELEKFKFVLDYKIKELKRQIEPRQNEIADMKEQIKEMDKELEQFHNSNAQLDAMIGELRAKLNTMQGEITKQRKKLGDQEAGTRRFRSELHECIQYVQNPKLLRESAVALYKNHSGEGAAGAGAEGGGELDIDIQAEYHRQRQYLERTVDSLKAKYARDAALHRQDNMRIMQDNMNAIKEISELRQYLTAAKLHQQEQSVLGAGGGKAAGAGQAPPAAPGDADPFEAIEAQRQHIAQLRERLGVLEKQRAVPGGAARQSMSRERLPPMPQPAAAGGDVMHG